MAKIYIDRSGVNQFDAGASLVDNHIVKFHAGFDKKEQITNPVAADWTAVGISAKYSNWEALFETPLSMGGLLGLVKVVANDPTHSVNVDIGVAADIDKDNFTNAGNTNITTLKTPTAAGGTAPDETTLKPQSVASVVSGFASNVVGSYSAAKAITVTPVTASENYIGQRIPRGSNIFIRVKVGAGFSGVLAVEFQLERYKEAQLIELTAG